MTVWWFGQLDGVVPNHLVSVDDPAIPAAVARPGDAMPAARHGARRGGRPRLPRRVRAARLPARQGRCAACRCRPVWRTRTGCRNRSSRRPPRPTSASTTRTSPSTQSPPPSGPSGRANPELTLRVYAHAARARRGARHHPGRHQARIRPRSGSGELVLGDEVLTPDSSRFWPADEWATRRAPARLRQAVRPRLAAVAPNPGGIVAPAATAAAAGDRRAATRERYVEAYERLTGLDFADWPG